MPVKKLLYNKGDSVTAIRTVMGSERGKIYYRLKARENTLQVQGAGAGECGKMRRQWKARDETCERCRKYERGRMRGKTRHRQKAHKYITSVKSPEKRHPKQSLREDLNEAT